MSTDPKDAISDALARAVSVYAREERNKLRELRQRRRPQGELDPNRPRRGPKVLPNQRRLFELAGLDDEGTSTTAREDD